MRRHWILLSLVAIICIGAAATPAGAPPAPPYQPEAQWRAFQFLMGTWSGTGIGTAGEGPGTMVVASDLDGAVLKITNSQNFGPKGGRAAFTYSSIMVISPNMKALFVDNEGHVLHYTARADGKNVTLLSVPERNSPRFRFTFKSVGEDKVDCGFDVAPLETPGKFTVHVHGVATKKK